MITRERGQRAAAMMVGEMDRRETTDAVKRFRPELRDAAESYLRQGEGVRSPLNRILEDAKMRREPVVKKVITTFRRIQFM